MDIASSHASSLSSASSLQPPPGWDWVKGIVDAAHWPDLGKPVRFEKTAKGWQSIIFNPDTKTTWRADGKGKKVQYKSSPITFVTATKVQHNISSSLDLLQLASRV